MSKNKEDLFIRSSKLSPAKRALLEARLRGNVGSTTTTTISRCPSSEPAPLSFAQQRLWFLQQLEPDNSFYNEHAALQFTGSLNVTALEQSLNAIVQRHEALRTTFEIADGQPVQIIASTLSIPLPTVDLSLLPEIAQQAEIQRLATEQSQRPFNLADAPLLRWSLLQLNEQEYVLLFTIHHIIFDGWSIDILIRELSAFYSACSTQQAPTPLPALPIQYADFAVWQRQWLQGESLESQLAYWKQRLNDAPPLLQLPTDRPRPSTPTYRGATESFLLSKQLTESLKTIAKNAETTLFMTLLTAFNILLYRYTGQEDAIVGLPIANRNRAEIEGLIGMFVNSLVLRTDLSGNPTVEELLGRVRQVMLEAYEHQDLPFEKLVEALQPDRNAHYNPLFQISFTLHNTPRTVFELPGLTITTLEVERRRALLDLRLDMTETNQGLLGCWEYNTDLFDAARIRRMSGHFQTLLEAISQRECFTNAANSQQRISELPLLTDAERQQSLQWNQTETDHPQVCIHQLFEAQVDRTPDATAITFANQSLTYQSLNQKSNQFAHYLQTLGVKPDVLVGICCDRSLDLAIGLLGILKAGAAYVPLDPDYPQERLQWMVSDSQMSILLTQSSLCDRLPAHGAQVICLDGDWATIAQHSPENLQYPICPSNLAYVIYTSGSTGKPKGVQIEHSSVVNFLTSMQHQPGLRPSDIVLAVTSISFDIAGLELYLPLMLGAQVVLTSRSIAADGKQLSNLLHASDATLMQATPATWRMLLASGWQGKRDLTILCGGEALSGDLAQSLLERGAAVWNLYGPTETTIWSTVYQLEQHNSFPSTIPIGRPIANTQIHLLDSQGQAVPVGVSGELHIGGAGLARGYLNRPDLTAEKFVIHPTWGRLYKTGDLAQYQPDGTIEYLGRIDHQVKLRGFRIELGEIEAILAQHASVREAVVIVREAAEGDQRLIAYVVALPETTIATHELREFLQTKLPNYMVPSAFVLLKKLPLTPNGKIDRVSVAEQYRNASPAPESEAVVVSTDSIPSNPIEEMLVNIWATILGTDRVGIHDNFFELGGHSLLATQVISQIRQMFQIELPLRSLFELPTIAQLAQAIATATKAASGLEAPPIQRRATEAVPLSFAQQRLWFLAELEPDNPFYNLPIAVSLQGLFNYAVLEQTFSEILRRHETLRTRIETQEGQAIARIVPPNTLQISPIDLSELSDVQQQTEVQQWMAIEAQRPFNLSHDPLLRVNLLRLSDHHYILLLTLHHIAADGWSFGILIREFITLYTAFCDGCPSPLPDLPIQYGDFAVWQRQWLREDVLQAQMNYWYQQLQDAPVVLELPTDYPRPAVQTYRGNSYRFELSPALSQALRQLSQQSGCTLFMTLLAAFDVLLGRYSRSEDIMVGTPIANRQRAEIEGLIGCFVNTLVLRTNLSDNPTVLELLNRVREVALSGYAHQDLPFEQLVEALQLERSLSHTPLFQVMFVLHNAPLLVIELSNLTVTPLETHSGTTQFDLTLSIVESAQELVATLEYNCDLFEETTIARMAGHYLTLLEEFTTQPQRQISELSLLNKTEQQQFVAWNQTQAAYSQALCIHHLFEAQVKRTPDAIAVVFEEQRISYRELNIKANQLAHYLNKLGVKSEVIVGLCLERSPEMLIALLGILKAGGAYLPLDPSYPPERLAFMLEDTQVSVLVTQQLLLNQLPDHQAQVICLDTDWYAIAQEETDNLIAPANADNLAYLIYTSGSTGIPKGVMIQHRSLVNYTEAIASEYELTADDRILQFASINFDVAAEEIFPCLMQGATLVLRTDEMLHSIPTFLRQVQTLKLTVLNLPTAFWHQFTAELATAQVKLPDTLRLVIIGGERASRDRLQIWHQVVNQQVRLINCYGPTETTIGATVCDLSEPEAIATRRDVPIGKPIQNVRTYVLDSYLQPVPIGVPGELYLGGAGVARGYLNRPELTTERFIDSRLPILESRLETDLQLTPKSKVQNSKSTRLYKTGDLVRYRPDGNLEYLGRIDTQVKIRGFRIELGEIEAALHQHPIVREAVVDVRETEPGDKRLVAYAVTENSLTLSISDLRQFLAEKLPAYMVPTVFVPIDALPLMPNGKVNRSALPEPDPIRPELNQTFVAPRTAIEITLADVWTQVLGVQQVGMHDNFFELGGDSILSIQMVARANQAGLQFTPKHVFEYQTIAELATVVRTKQRTLVEQGSLIGSVLLTPIQHWFFEQNLPDSHHFNQAVVLEISQQIDLALLEQSLYQLLIHHDALRLQFELTESGWQQSYTSPDSRMLLLRWDFSALTAAEQKLAFESAATEVQTSLNLSTGSLVRAGFFNLSEHQPSRLLIVIHHLVIDGVSWRILLEDLQTAYQQLSRGEAVKLPAKTTSFQQWSQTLRQYAHSILPQEQEYWLKQPPFTPLPIDYSDGKNTVASADRLMSTLSVPDTQALLKDVPKAYHTEINDVLLTALVQAFAQWTGTHSLLIDLEGHGRENLVADIDVSRTVGWFTTVFPVYLKLEATHPGDALKGIKEQLRGIPNRGIGYGLLRYGSNNPKIIEQLKNRSQAEVLFNYLGQFNPSPPNSSLFHPIQAPSGSAQSLQGNRSHVLEINAWISDQQLHLHWNYSQAIYRRSTIEALAEKFLRALRSLMTHCQSPEAGGYTPSDFSEANLNQQALDRFLSKIKHKG